MSRHHKALGGDQGRLRRAALDRDDWRCVRCGSPLDLECHHLVPLDKGGEHVIDNVRMLCADCHIDAHRTIDPERDRWRRLLLETA